MLRVLQIGRTGQVATEFAVAAAEAGFAHTVLSRPELDLNDPASVRRTVSAHEFDVLVNCAAYTAVDQAESDQDAARRLNVESVEAMGLAAADKGAVIIHLSTDYVFDGSALRAYRETDSTSPLGVYGRTKLDGERRLAAASPRHVIVRTAWVYASHGKNFVKTMLRIGREREVLAVVDDQHGSPTSAADIARALVTITTQTASAPEGDPRFGVFHFCGGGETTWRLFAEEIFAQARDWPYPSPEVRPIESKDFPTPAKRPANSVLDTERVRAVFGIEIRPWQQSLAEVMSELKKEQA